MPRSSLHDILLKSYSLFALKTVRISPIIGSKSLHPFAVDAAFNFDSNLASNFPGKSIPGGWNAWDRIDINKKKIVEN